MQVPVCVILVTLVVLQILLALPDRPETQHFFGAADVAGLTWRRLSHSCPPDPATPVSIYQFVQRAYWNVSYPVRAQTSPNEASPSKRCKVSYHSGKERKVLCLLECMMCLTRACLQVLFCLLLRGPSNLLPTRCTDVTCHVLLMTGGGKGGSRHVQDAGSV